MAELAVGWTFGDRVKPRDICVLPRNKPADYTDILIREFAGRGVKARVETDLQDLLIEPLVRVAMGALSLAVRGRDREAWASLVGLLRDIHGLDESDPRVRQVDAPVNRRLPRIGNTLRVPDCDLNAVRREFAAFFDILGLDAFRRL